MTELLAVILELTLLDLPKGFISPIWWGGFAHGLLLQAIAKTDQGLASHYHNGSGLKPYTVSDLVGATPRQPLDAEACYRLRITSLDPKLTVCLQQSLENGFLSIGRAIELGPVTFKISAHDAANPHWCGTSDYHTLSTSCLMPGQKLETKINFKLGSPTVFKKGTRFDPLPSPVPVFASLLRRWNHWSQVAFSPDLLHYIEGCLVTTRYNLHTRLAGSKDGGLRPGAVGIISYSALHYDGYWLSLLHTLGSFAKYAGIGSGVTLGMGQAYML